MSQGFTNTPLVISAHSDVQTGHIRAGNMQILEDTSVTYHDIVGIVTESVDETVGPTGSGATNIIADMDNMSDKASIVIFRIGIQITTSGTTGGHVYFFADSNDVTSLTHSADGSQKFGLNIQKGATGSNDTHTSWGIVMIPIDANGVFKASWEESNTTDPNIWLRYQGFIEDL